MLLFIDDDFRDEMFQFRIEFSFVRCFSFSLREVLSFLFANLVQIVRSMIALLTDKDFLFVSFSFDFYSLFALLCAKPIAAGKIKSQISTNYSKN